MTRDHVLKGRVMLSDASVMELEELSPETYDEKAGAEGTREAEIYSGFKNIMEQNRKSIENAYPRVMRRVQGYNLDLFTDRDHWNLMKLIIGSEGTLGVFLESTLKLVPLPKSKVLCTVHFSDLLQAIRTVSPILEHGPSAVEIMDDDIVSRPGPRIVEGLEFIAAALHPELFD